jgi:hypothetical protein
MYNPNRANPKPNEECKFGRKRVGERKKRHAADTQQTPYPAKKHTPILQRYEFFRRYASVFRFFSIFFYCKRYEENCSDNLVVHACFWNEQKGSLSVVAANSGLYRLGK